MMDIPENYTQALAGIRYIDLFAGIGGFHLAMKSLGAKCVLASEWDKYAAKVYARNFGINPQGDITKIHENDIPSHDVICAGFPCQAFSISGKQQGFEESRGTLFFDIARIAKHHRPAMLFLENVRNFARHDEGRTLAVVENTLKELGYHIYYKVLNASHYGLPQKRERIFILAFKQDLGITAFHFPKPSYQPIALESCLDLDSTMPTIEREDIRWQGLDNACKKDKSGKEILPNKTIRIGTLGKGGQGERIYHTKGHAVTLSAYGGGVGAKTGLYLVNGKVRRLSPRECARVQGFPDTFLIDQRPAQAYKQFGNSVAVNVLQHILLQVIKTTSLVDFCKKSV